MSKASTFVTFRCIAKTRVVRSIRPSGRCRGVGRGRRSVPAAHDGEPGEGDGDADIVIRIKVDAPVLKRSGAGEPSALVARPKSSELERTGGGPAAVLRNLVEDMPA
jgi:hypothetical protein